ncbi:hypothetical protein VTO42DRAFT_6886 [Malbranchea cinnamomea]
MATLHLDGRNPDGSHGSSQGKNENHGIATQTESSVTGQTQDTSFNSIQPPQVSEMDNDADNNGHYDTNGHWASGESHFGDTESNADSDDEDHSRDGVVEALAGIMEAVPAIELLPETWMASIENDNQPGPNTDGRQNGVGPGPQGARSPANYMYFPLSDEAAFADDDLVMVDGFGRQSECADEETSESVLEPSTCCHDIEQRDAGVESDGDRKLFKQLEEALYENQRFENVAYDDREEHFRLDNPELLLVDCPSGHASSPGKLETGNEHQEPGIPGGASGPDDHHHCGGKASDDNAGDYYMDTPEELLEHNEFEEAQTPDSIDGSFYPAKESQEVNNHEELLHQRQHAVNHDKNQEVGHSEDFSQDEGRLQNEQNFAGTEDSRFVDMDDIERLSQDGNYLHATDEAKTSSDDNENQVTNRLRDIGGEHSQEENNFDNQSSEEDHIQRALPIRSHGLFHTIPLDEDDVFGPSEPRFPFHTNTHMNETPTTYYYNGQPVPPQFLPRALRGANTFTGSLITDTRGFVSTSRPFNAPGEIYTDPVDWDNDHERMFRTAFEAYRVYTHPSSMNSNHMDAEKENIPPTQESQGPLSRGNEAADQGHPSPNRYLQQESSSIERRLFSFGPLRPVPSYPVSLREISSRAPITPAYIWYRHHGRHIQDVPEERGNATGVVRSIDEPQVQFDLAE